MAKKEKTPAKVNIRNKRATFDYEILETFTAGIVLYGTEIKSVRAGKASLSDSYCIVHDREMWVRNVYIAEYFFGSYNNHDARRERKLLLTRQEIRKIAARLKDVGITLIPIRLYLNERGLAKMTIGLAKGKKAYDKRASLREKDIKRELAATRKIRY